ncbi:MAG: hypothetical protein MJK04_35215, partial [Psychrosphaera sp.]|nr:hypothetical protein [Psychrosphaera sp.]
MSCPQRLFKFMPKTRLTATVLLLITLSLMPGLANEPKTNNTTQPVINFSSVSGSGSLKNGWVLKVLQDSQGFIWAATQNGLYRYDGYRFKAFLHDPDDDHSLANNYIHTLFEDSQGTLWVGSQGGVLHRFINQSATFKRFPIDQSYPITTASTSRVMSVVQYNDNLWVGTFGGGLYQFDLKMQKFTRSFRYDPFEPNSLSDDK